MKKQPNILLLFLSVSFVIYFFITGADFPEGEKNPFKDCFPLEPKKTEQEVVKKEEKKPLDVTAYNLTGVVWGDYEARAVINNKIYRVGDKLDEAKVISIDKKGVVLEYEGEKYTLNTKSYGGG